MHTRAPDEHRPRQVGEVAAHRRRHHEPPPAAVRLAPAGLRACEGVRGGMVLHAHLNPSCLVS